MGRVRKLLETLDYQVTVFDGPDQRPPSEVINNEIEKADCIVALFGPDFDADPVVSAPATWPYQEVIHAHALRKPIALIVHPGTTMPEILGEYQTPARFDFRDPVSYADKVHHVVSHLLDTKRRLEIPPGDAPYYYQRAAFSFRVDEEREYITHDVYHQVVARQAWDTLRHSIDMGPDVSASAHLRLRNKDNVAIVGTSGAMGHIFDLEWGPADQHSQKYFVTLRPQIQPGGQIGYRRKFRLDNYFPLTAQELAARATEPGFPSVFRQKNILYYGVCADVTSEMESLTVTLEFPAGVSLRSSRAVAVHAAVQRVNDQETDRIGRSDAFSMTESEKTGDTTMELFVRRPLAGHSYLLLYEPGD